MTGDWWGMALGLPNLSWVLEGIEWGAMLGSFFGLLVPGMITVVGSFFLYNKRRADRKRALRSSLRTEIHQMTSLDSLANELDNLTATPPAQPIPSSKLPPSGVLPTRVYEGNVQSLGLLDEDVRNSVVEFYSKISNQKALIQGIRNGDGIPGADHKELYETIPQLKEDRECLLSQLDHDT